MHNSALGVFILFFKKKFPMKGRKLVIKTHTQIDLPGPFCKTTS
jgi:hypothetical protein